MGQATGDGRPQLSPAMIEWCGPGHLDHLAGLDGVVEARRGGGLDADQRTVEGSVAADPPRYQRPAAAAKAPTPIGMTTTSGVPTPDGRQLFVELVEDRGVAVDHPRGNRLVPRPRRVGDDQAVVRRLLGRPGRRRPRRCRRRPAQVAPSERMPSMRAAARARRARRCGRRARSGGRTMPRPGRGCRRSPWPGSSVRAPSARWPARRTSTTRAPGRAVRRAPGTTPRTRPAS